MKSSKVLLNVSLVLIWILTLVAELLTGLIVWRLDLLPEKYMLILVVLLSVVSVVLGLMILLPRKRKKPGNLRCGAGCVLAALMVAGCMAISTVASDVHDTLTEVAKPTPQSGVRMAVYIRADDPAQSLEQAKGYVFATMEGYEVNRTAHVVSYLSSKLGEEVVPVNYSGITQLLDALYNREADAVILNSAYLTILHSVDGYSDFEERTKVLCEVELVEQSKPQNQPKPDDGQGDEQNENTNPAVDTKPRPDDVTNTPFVVYISGSDTRSSKLTTGNSDVNILAIVNPVTKQVLLLNTPRDYYIPNPAGNGALDKLTHCGIYGAECSMEALSDLYGIGIDYYAKINFAGFETMVDAIGGVTVYSDVAFSNAGVTVSVGENYFNGSQALAFARERKLLAGGDNDRGKNQMKIIKAVLQKVMSSSIITQYADVLDSLEGMFETSMDRTDINSLVKMQLSDMATWKIDSFAVTGEGDSRTNYSLPGLSVYVMLPDEGLVAQASGLIDKVVAGEILTENDLIPVS